MLDAKNESAFLNRAITNTLLKNFEEAKADFEKAVCLSPFSAAVYYNKANLYNTLKQYEQAEEDISKGMASAWESAVTSVSIYFKKIFLDAKIEL